MKKLFKVLFLILLFPVIALAADVIAPTAKTSFPQLTIGEWIALVIGVLNLVHAILLKFPSNVNNQIANILEEIISFLNPFTGLLKKLVPDVQTDGNKVIINGNPFIPSGPTPDAH